MNKRVRSLTRSGCSMRTTGCVLAVVLSCGAALGAPATFSPPGDLPALDHAQGTPAPGTLLDPPPEPVGCTPIPPCEALTKFKARCRVGIVGRLIIKVKLEPPIGELNVLIGVNGQPFCVPFRRNTAKLVLDGRVGQQVCEVLIPPNCFNPIIVDCH